MRKPLFVFTGLAALFCGGLLSIQQSGYDMQTANAQGEDQLFKDCRSRLLELGNRMSELSDRAPYEDIRTEAAAVWTEFLVAESDCESVLDRLAQDPAMQFLNEYLMERAGEVQ